MFERELAPAREEAVATDPPIADLEVGYENVDEVAGGAGPGDKQSYLPVKMGDVIVTGY